MELKNDVVTRMKEKAESVHAVVTQIRSIEEAFEYAIHLTRSQGGQTIAAPVLSESEQSSFALLCQENGIILLTENLWQYAIGIHTGFTHADWGIAETGTLVIESSGEDIRIATSISEAHVAVLARSRIRPAFQDIEEELAQLMKFSSRFLAFITGPSRTSDIEQVLVIGAHGPRQLHILIMEVDDT